MSARILCIWFPNWTIQRIQRATPPLSGRMLLVEDAPANGTTNRTTSRTNSVQACSTAAARAGVYPGMPLAEAKALLAPHPLTIQPSDAVADYRALEELAQQLQSFSPLVGLEDLPQPESLLLDIASCCQLFGGEAELADQVTRRLGHEKYEFSLAIADTVGAAWAAAHYDARAICSAVPSANQPISIPPGATDVLDQLPVAALRLSPATIDLLEQLGIYAIGQLFELPRNSLSSRFGSELLRRMDQLRGTAMEPIRVSAPPCDIRATRVLEHPTTDRTLLEHVVSLLVEQISEQLRQRDCGAIHIDCQLRIVNQQPTCWRAGLFQPSAQPTHLCELLGMHLESLQVSGPVEEVVVSVPVSGRLSHPQYELFDDEEHADSHHWAVLVNRLSSRLGDTAVVRPQWQTQAEPERAYRCIPLTRHNPRKRSRTQHVASRPSAQLPRPLWLYPTPQPVAVVCLAPDGPPQYLWHRHRRQQIVAHWGPERIETGWWRGATVRRDYYRIETDQGCRQWLFRCLYTDRWFLHGEFV